jgi:hypothetical protein
MLPDTRILQIKFNEALNVDANEPCPITLTQDWGNPKERYCGILKDGNNRFACVNKPDDVVNQPWNFELQTRIDGAPHAIYFNGSFPVVLPLDIQPHAGLRRGYRVQAVYNGKQQQWQQ